MRTRSQAAGCGVGPFSLEKGRHRGHIACMPQYVDEAFVVLVHIYGVDEDERPLREQYVVGCPTREAAEDRIRSFFPPGPDIKVFASPLSASETAALNLLPDEVRPFP